MEQKDSITLEDLGGLMEEARKRKDANGKKISREAIGRYIGVSGQTIYEWEKGRQHPGFLNVVKFCGFLGMTPDELLGIKKKDFCMS
jgi:transcriptional regulator with XRE-family HTH domain